MDLHVIPECYIDTKLLKIAVPPRGRYNHQKGCTNVVKQMQEKLSGDFALGLIDKDKKILKYTEEFDTVIEVKDRLELLKHPSRHHYLIFISPAQEKWIIAVAEEVGLSLTEFNLPHDFNQLRDITKTSKSENDDPHSANFQQLFKEIKKKQSRYLKVLSFWVSYLKDNPYSADLEWIAIETDRILDEP
ncbi:MULTISPECIES: hypothetical protein [unclassified Spirosoma]|uniref:hypothetical protein n=1 Tax=unclassified Spirosoma TaxID=2621999 RepID=UPI0009668D16|nr:MULTISPECIES: hypothetical protein [unclassified Spirosoma]MBN8825800.1 hypothetical protein [Spirosoma sp.]OJW74391.1 MAG: hypothetical protein BGO59_19380 [Spirosoma sp. 48-14]